MTLIKNYSHLNFRLCTNSIYFDKLLYYNLTKYQNVHAALHLEGRKKEEALFLIGYEVGGSLLNNFWLISSDLVRKIEFYTNEYFTPASYVIGIQLRYGDADLPYLNEYVDILKFINCAIYLENEYLSSKRKSEKFNIKWFIASDSQSKLDLLLKEYERKAFASKGTLAHIKHNHLGYERSIIDVELLSKCDELIITGASSFGFIAAMKSKKLPYFINGFDKTMRRCQRMQFANPNFRMPKTPLGFTLF